MTSNGSAKALQVHRLPQSNYIDALRWLPSLSAFDRFIVLAAFDSDSSRPSIEILGLENPSSSSPNLTLQHSQPSPSRVSSLKTSQTHHKPLIASSTFSGSLHVFLANPSDGSVEAELSLPENVLHTGPVSCIDLIENGSECLTIGEDGKINLVSITSDSRLSYRRILDGNGLISYTAARWASPYEFATGGLGFSLQWWDQRRPGGPASQFKCNWVQGPSSGIVHSIDIHPSRKHTCLAGGSSGTVFAWDLRWQQQPIILSGVGTGDTSHVIFESEIWEIQCDTCTNSFKIGDISSSKVLPAMVCSEDGILAVVEQGKEPIELLAEPCAINSFDIDKHNPSEVICSLEWESVALLMRP